MKYEFRDLTKDEVECRVGTIDVNKGCSLVLFKDARCDMNILDQKFGITGWKRHHESINGNLFCTVEIWDDSKKEWISKQDVGKKTGVEKEKGQASDSFKRACFNIGIGRELYTAPFIWIYPKDVKIENGKVKDSFSVADLEIENKKIVKLKIRNNRTKKVVFSFPSSKDEQDQGEMHQEPVGKQKISKEKQKSLLEFCDEKHLDIGKILDSYALKDISELNENQHATIIRVHAQYMKQWGADGWNA